MASAPFTTTQGEIDRERLRGRPPSRPIDQLNEIAKGIRERTEQQRQEPALRYDGGKPRYDLLPTDALEEVAKVYAWGAAKYEVDNWTKGMAWRRCLGSLLRHAFAWSAGEDRDKESGLHHMAHCAWNALALISYAKRRVGKDDRVKAGALNAD